MKGKRIIAELRIVNPTKEEMEQWIKKYKITYGNNNLFILDLDKIDFMYAALVTNKIGFAPFMINYENKGGYFTVKRIFADIWNMYHNYEFNWAGSHELGFCGFHNGSKSESMATLTEYELAYGICRLTYDIETSIKKALYTCKMLNTTLRNEELIIQWLKTNDEKCIYIAKQVMRILDLPVNGLYYAAKVYKAYMLDFCYSIAKYDRKCAVESKTDVAIFDKDGNVCKRISVKFGNLYQLCSMQIKELLVYGFTLSWNNDAYKEQYTKLINSLIRYDVRDNLLKEDKELINILFRKHFTEFNSILTAEGLWTEFYRYAITGENKFGINHISTADTIVNIKLDNSVYAYNVNDYLIDVVYEHANPSFSKKSSNNKGTETLRILINH